MMTLSLAVFTFGALAFSSLAWSVLAPAGVSTGLFRLFTLMLCALAFLSPTSWPRSSSSIIAGVSTSPAA